MILIVLGTRSETIKFSTLIDEFRARNIDFKIVHTGQHDTLNLMSLLKLPQPDYYFGKSKRTAWSKSKLGPIIALYWSFAAVIKLRKIIEKTNPDMIIYNGNTMNVPITCFSAKTTKNKSILVHRESGLRANSKDDIILDLFRKTGEYFGNILFTPSRKGFDTISKNYRKKSIFFIGDSKVEIIQRTLKIKEYTKPDKDYALINVIRSVKTNQHAEKLCDIISEIPLHTILCLNPKIKTILHQNNLLQKIQENKKIEIRDHVEYPEFLNLINNSKVVLTDSEGVEEEAAILQKPCITMNTFLQYQELKDFTLVAGLDKDKIIQFIRSLDKIKTKKYDLGDGKASKRIADIIESIIKNKLTLPV